MKTTTWEGAGRVRPTRRGFLKACALGLTAAGAGAQTAPRSPPGAPGATRVPLKIGIRASCLKMVGDPDVVRVVAGMDGLRGVEPHVAMGVRNMRDPDVVRLYKRESDRWDVRIPSMTGMWDRGVNIAHPSAPDNLRLAIRAGETLGCSTLLVASFKNDAPDMSKEASYGPVVKNLQAVADAAANAGISLAMENSLSPADNVKLVDWVAHPAVGVYYDLHNMAFYGHGDQAIPGVALLGRERIRAVHVKNADMLIETPGLVDWAAAFASLNAIGYDGWYVYESQHKTTEACIADTAVNTAFLRNHIRMPLAPSSTREHGG